MKFRFKSCSIRSQIIFLVALGCIFSVAIFSWFSWRIIREHYDQIIEQNYQLGLNSTGLRLSQAMDEMHLVSSKLTCAGGIIRDVEDSLISRNITDQMQFRNSVRKNLILDDFANNVIGTIVYYFPGLPDTVYLSNCDLSIGSRFTAAAADFFCSRSPDSLFFPPRLSITGIGTGAVLSMSRTATQVADYKVSIYLETDINFLTDLFSALTDAAGAQLPIYLTDCDGLVLYQQGGIPEYIGQSFPRGAISLNYEIFSYENDSFSLFLCAPSQEYNQIHQSLMRQFFTILLIFIAVYVLLAFLIYHAAYSPLDRFIAKLSRNDISGLYLDNARYSREFNEYYQRIDQLRSQICQLMSKVELSARQNAQLEYELLLSRIDPHFLHNALGNISAQARLSGQQELAQTITCLNSLLYHNLGKRKDTTLEDELQAADDYIMLYQKMTSLQYRREISVPSETLKMQIPAFILQPILENCVKHGNRENLSILLRVYLLENVLHIDVLDNGQGLTTQKRDELNQSFSSGNSENMGIGLRYIASSLQYYFTNRARLQIDHNPEQHGTMISITICL